MLLVIGLGGRVELASWLSDTDMPELHSKGTCHPDLHWKAKADGVCLTYGQVKAEENV